VITTSAQILRRAAELLETRGWCQNEGVDGQGRMCAMGAIHTASVEVAGHGYTVDTSPTRATEEYVGVTPIWVWNDEPQRKAEDVIKVFREVADLEDFR
jgi:hypothetical protein